MNVFKRSFIFFLEVYGLVVNGHTLACGEAVFDNNGGKVTNLHFADCVGEAVRRLKTNYI